MAEQNNENQTINFAGREIDKKEFGRRVLAKLGAWMDYQGLQGDERTDFINALNDKMNGLLSGDYTSSDFGVIQGGASNQENQYEQNGSRSDSKFSLSRRHGFNPGENVDVYLNGIAGTMDEGATSSTKSSKKSDWNKNAMALQIMESIFGEGNKASVAQMKLWADKYDPVSNGARATLGRKDYLIRLINDYRNKVANGEYDLEGEDLTKELEKIDNLVEALNNNDNFNMNKVAPWLSDLLFTEENYYNTPEEKQAAEQQALAKKGEDYIKNGGENPYNKETQSELWQAAEDARKAQIDQNQLDEFDNYSIRSTNLQGEHWLPKYTMIDKGDVFRDWEYDGTYGWKHMLDALYKVNSDYSRDGSGYDLYSGWTHSDLLSPVTNPENMSHDKVDFTGIIPDLYMRTYDEPNDVWGRNTNKYQAGRSGNAYKGKFLSDYLNYYINLNPDKFRIAADKSLFILPSMVDWNKGTAYLITQLMDLKGSIKQVNIADLLPDIKNNNPELYQELLQYYKKARGYKKGGVIKAQFGTSLGSSEAEDVEAQKDLIRGMGLDKFNRLNLEKSTSLSPADKMRIGAIAADVISTATAFAPGIGTGIAAVTGIGSTGTNLIADLRDPTVSGGLVLGNLAINAGLDIASLVPGLNVGAGPAKIAKTLTKMSHIILPALAMVSNGPEAVAAAKKIMSGQKLTSGDWKHLAYGMSALAGTSRIATNAYRVHLSPKYKAPGRGKTDFIDTSYNESGVIKPVRLSKSDFDAVNNQTTQEGALKLFREKVAAAVPGVKQDNIQFANRETFGKKLKILNKPLKGEEVTTDPDLLAYRQKAARENAEIREHGITKWLTQNLGLKTNYEMLGIVPTIYKGTEGQFSSPWAIRAGANKATKSEFDAITKAQKDFGNGVKAAPNAEQLAEINDITSKRKTAQDSVKKAEKELNLTKNADSRIADLDKIRKRQTTINTRSQNIENKINDINRISQLEGRLNIAKNAKRSASSTQLQRVINLLETEINNLKVKTGNVKDLNKELTILQKRLANLKAMPKLILLKRLLSIESRIKQIKTAKTNEAQLRLAAENGRNQVAELDEKRAGIDRKLQWETYNHYRDLVKRVYGLKHGGILKANLGTLIPPKPKLTSTTNSTNIGTLGNPSTNIGTLGNTPETNTGTLGNSTKPSNSTFKGYDNGLNPLSHWGIPMSNSMLSLLQKEKNSLALGVDYGILLKQLAKMPYHKDPMIYGYKVHTSKPYEDTVAKIKSNFNLLGNLAASGTSDLGSAFAYKLNALKTANEYIFPYAKEQSNFVLAGEDKAREAAYLTMQSYHDTGEFNHEQDVNKYNNDKDAESQYLSQYGNILMNDLTMRQRGLAATAKYNYQRSLLADDAMYHYRRLLDKKTNNPKDWTQDDEIQLARAYRQWIKVNRLTPIEMPYTGYQLYYTTNKPFETFFI